MQVSALLVLCACLAMRSDATPTVVPLRLEMPLQSMKDAAAGILDHVVTAYHVPVGVEEAARIKAAEEQMEIHNQTERRPELMIVGGLGSFRGEHPFMAGLVISLTSGETSVCGGSLISGSKVLTAAACYWDGYSQATAMQVVLGSTSLFSGGTRVYATTVLVHSSYTPASIHNNLAILTVPYQSSTTYVKPIAMASTSDQFVGTRAEVIGYGRTADGAPITTSASQRDVFVNVLSNLECQQYYGSSIVTSAEICTSGAGGRNPCGGDQGGPLIIYSSAGNDLLLGVFTFGSSSGCEAGAPSGYMRISYFYNWIRSKL